MDFLTVPTITFELIYVFFVIDHARRVVLQVNATRHPTSAWICQQLREAFPFDEAPRFLIFDRDAKFGSDLSRLIPTLGIRPIRIAFRSPWQNGAAERWVGSVRRDMLDHVIVLNERHLRRLLREYRDYHNNDRCHLALAKDAPAARHAERSRTPRASVLPKPGIGGLHHRYHWREAA
jgi:transposase InsO family protein